MLRKLLFNLQLFAEGGDGGDGGSSAPAGDGQTVEATGEEVPAFIPEKAKNVYKKALAKSKKSESSVVPVQQPAVESKAEDSKQEHIPYSDLIKSDEYKEEHKAYMDKTISDRLKKYKGMEESYGKLQDTLGIMASKYGLDPEADNFVEALREKIEEDDSFYEKYAMDNDMSVEEAKHITKMERKVQKMEQREQELQRQEAQRAQIQLLVTNAEKTKIRFPEFDLETEMQDERFRNLCAVNHGDTTAAYMACHWEQVMNAQINAQVQKASQQIQQQTANAVAANMARPVENGMSSNTPSVTNVDFKNMSLQQIRQYAAEQRRLQNGR